MSMVDYAQVQKHRAIETHSLQAAEFALSYQELRKDAYQSCFAYSRHRLDRWLERYLPPRGDGLRLLDVGCGTGHHLARLRQRGFDVVGVDGSAEMLAHARANNPGVELERADVEEIPFPDGSFDFVLCIEVLRYLPQSSRCIKEMARLLKPGGVCLATATPVLNLNGYWLVNRIANLISISDLVRLKQFFTTSGRLRREFLAAGFAAPELHGVYFGPINWLERLARPQLAPLLKLWEPVDATLTDRPLLRELSNMFLVRAVRRA
jgi:ubiquinone/menaquinone biosynthesis C-methylase UbiE